MLTRKVLLEALVDLLDGQDTPEEIQATTGLSLSRCKEIAHVAALAWRELNAPTPKTEEVFLTLVDNDEDNFFGP